MSAYETPRRGYEGLENSAGRQVLPQGKPVIATCVEIDVARYYEDWRTFDWNIRRALEGTTVTDVVKLSVGRTRCFLPDEVVAALQGRRVQITAEDGHTLREWETYLLGGADV